LNSSVFSWRQNTKYVDNILTDEGNAFQARAAATGKARSPRVARRVDGTSSVDVDPDIDDPPTLCTKFEVSNFISSRDNKKFTCRRESLKVIQTDTIRKLGRGFLLVPATAAIRRRRRR